MERILRVFVLLLALSTLSQCYNDSERLSLASVEFRLTDAPADYEQVNVEILSLLYHTTENGWEEINNFNSGIYNLLDFRNGTDTLLGNAELPPGKLTQLRLILGNQNTLLIDGQIRNLSVPGGQQSGIIIPINIELIQGVSYNILLDFDAARSVKPRPNGYNLVPVIRVIDEEKSGRVQGHILPLEARAVLYVQNPSDTITAFTGDDGFFMVRGVKPGTYQVRVEPQSGYKGVTRKNVLVVSGSVANMGFMVLEEGDEEDE